MPQVYFVKVYIPTKKEKKVYYLHIVSHIFALKFQNFSMKFVSVIFILHTLKLH